MQAAELDPWSAEADQKADFDSGCAEIIDHLRLMLGSERPQRLHLDQDPLVYDDVRFEIADDLTSELDFDRSLRGDFQSILTKSDQQSGVIHALEESMT